MNFRYVILLPFTCILLFLCSCTPINDPSRTIASSQRTTTDFSEESKMRQNASFNEPPSTYYSIGKQGAENQLNAAFSDLGCINLNKLDSIVDNQVSFAMLQMRTKYKGIAARDFGKGYINGLQVGIEHFKISCPSLNTRETSKMVEKYTFSINSVLENI